MKKTILLTISVLLMTSCSQEQKLRETSEKLYSQYEVHSDSCDYYGEMKTLYEEDYLSKHGTTPNPYSDSTYEHLKSKEEYHLYRSIGILNDITKVGERLKELELGL